MGVGGRTHLQIDIGLRQGQILKEGMGHVFVIMLTGMNQEMVNWSIGGLVIRVDGLDDRRDLHEVGPCPGDEDEFHRRFPSKIDSKT